MKPEILRWRPQQWAERLENENLEGYMRLYHIRFWILSFASPLFMAVPVYLFLNGVSAYSGYTYLDLFLFVLLIIVWVGVPALFVFFQTRQSKRLQYLSWFWAFYTAAVFGLWVYFIAKWFPLT